MKLENFWNVIAKHPWLLAVVVGDEIQDVVKEGEGDVRQSPYHLGALFCETRLGFKLWDQIDYIAFRTPASFPIDEGYGKQEIVVERPGEAKLTQQGKTVAVGDIKQSAEREVSYLMLLHEVGEEFFTSQIAIDQRAPSTATVGNVIQYLNEKRNPPPELDAVVRVTKTHCDYRVKHENDRFRILMEKEGDDQNQLHGLRFARYAYDVWLVQTNSR